MESRNKPRTWKERKAVIDRWGWGLFSFLVTNGLTDIKQIRYILQAQKALLRGRVQKALELIDLCLDLMERTAEIYEPAIEKRLRELIFGTSFKDETEEPTTPNAKKSATGENNNGDYGNFPTGIGRYNM